MVKVHTDKFFINKYGKKVNGFYLDGILKNNLDKYFIRAVKNDLDGIAVISGTEGCLSGETKILLKNKEKKIKDCNNFEIVRAYDFKKNIVVNQLAKVINSGIKEVYELELESGKKVQATLDHKFFIKKNNKIIEKRLKDIKVKDEIICKI